MKILCNSVLHNFFYPKLDTSPFDSIWLEISLSWHTKSQGPKKKCTHFTIERIHSWLADTARNQGSFTTFALWSVQSFNSPTVHSKSNPLTSLNNLKYQKGITFINYSKEARQEITFHISFFYYEYEGIFFLTRKHHL